VADLDGRSRGQIILVAAFALAVIFITLALIVNSAIFTQNLASRGETSGADDALSHRAMVEASVGENVEIANRRNNSSYTDLDEAIESSVENMSVQSERQQVQSGQLTRVRYMSGDYTDGVRIAQTDGSSFESGGEETYLVAENVERVADANGTRAFRINASGVAASTNNTAFEVKVNESSADGNRNSWRMRLWTESSPDTVNIKTLRNDSGTNTEETCSVPVDSPTSSYRIDVTGGTVEGRPCDALGTRDNGDNFHFGSGTGVGTSGQYDIYFRSANVMTGNFSLVVHDAGGLNIPLPLLGFGTPYETNALYSVTVGYTYETSGLYYDTRIRVAPGEPDA